MNPLIHALAMFEGFVLITAVIVIVTTRREPPLNREALRRELERAEKRHAPRKHLRKAFVEATRQELAS